MDSLSKNKIIVNISKEVSKNELSIPRKYTVDHSDETGDIFITIAKEYDKNEINKNKEQVYGMWCESEEGYMLCLKVDVDGYEDDLDKIMRRDKIFREELPLAIAAIRHSDIGLIESNPKLDDSKILIEFNSRYKDLKKNEVWGRLKDYKMVEKFRCIYNFEIKDSVDIKKQGTINMFRRNKKSMEEDIILNLLRPYILTRLCTIFGEATRYGIRNMEIVDIDEINIIGVYENTHRVYIKVDFNNKHTSKKVKFGIRITENNIVFETMEDWR